MKHAQRISALKRDKAIYLAVTLILKYVEQRHDCFLQQNRHFNKKKYSKNPNLAGFVSKF